jgi:chromosomal replication initiation ATPase DnaA
MTTSEELLKALKGFNLKELSNRSAGYAKTLITQLAKETRNVIDNEKMVRFIVSMLEDYYKIDLSIKTRRDTHVEARQVLMLLLKDYTFMSLNEIKDYLGVKNHDTIIYGIKHIKEEMDVYADLVKRIQEFEKRIIDESNSIQEVQRDRASTHSHVG